MSKTVKSKYILSIKCRTTVYGVDFHILADSGWWVCRSHRDKFMLWSYDTHAIPNSIYKTTKFKNLFPNVQEALSKYSWMFNDPFSWATSGVSTVMRMPNKYL